MKALVDALAGALFGLGLVISGMTRPGKVIGFLDVSGHWDPSLALVMAGALLVHGLVLFGAREQERAWLGETRVPPRGSGVDARLVIGAAIFGIGWGLVGYCPGPAIVGAAATKSAALFAVAMVGGMALHAVVARVFGWNGETADLPLRQGPGTSSETPGPAAPVIRARTTT